jgi:hypothetical protein
LSLDLSRVKNLSQKHFLQVTLAEGLLKTPGIAKGSEPFGTHTIFHNY